MLADLTSGLDEDETQTLKEAGLIPGDGKKGKRKEKGIPKKIIFGTDETGEQLLLHILD